MHQLPDFKRLATELQVLTGRTLSDRLSAHALLFFQQRFRAQAWADHGTEPWKKRKDLSWAKNRKGRALLIQTGRLRRSIRIVSNNGRRIVIGTDVPYAQMHNEGFRGTITQKVSAHTRRKTEFGIVKRTERKRSTRIDYGRVQKGTIDVKAHTRKIKVNVPKRRFIGRSAVLDKQLARIVQAEINKAMKSINH